MLPTITRRTSQVTLPKPAEADGTISDGHANLLTTMVTQVTWGAINQVAEK
jgi:hypothetical protein